MSDRCIICHAALDYPGIWCLACQKLEWSIAESELEPDSHDDDDDSDDENE